MTRAGVVVVVLATLGAAGWDVVEVTGAGPTRLAEGLALLVLLAGCPALAIREAGRRIGRGAVVTVLLGAAVGAVEPWSVVGEPAVGGQVSEPYAVGVLVSVHRPTAIEEAVGWAGRGVAVLLAVTAAILVTQAAARRSPGADRAWCSPWVAAAAGAVWAFTIVALQVTGQAGHGVPWWAWSSVTVLLVAIPAATAPWWPPSLPEGTPSGDPNGASSGDPSLPVEPRSRTAAAVGAFLGLASAAAPGTAAGLALVLVAGGGAAALGTWLAGHSTTGRAGAVVALAALCGHGLAGAVSLVDASLAQAVAVATVAGAAAIALTRGGWVSSVQ